MCNIKTGLGSQNTARTTVRSDSTTVRSDSITDRDDRALQGVRASEVGAALDEKRFTPPNIEARPSASGARRRSYTRGSE